MVKARREGKRVPVLAVFARLWRQRDARRWIVHGHDGDGRSASVRVAFGEHGVTMMPSCSGQIVLEPMQAGRLRAAIRDAIESIDQPASAARRIADTPVDRPMPKPRPPSPRPRVRVVLEDPEPATRPRFRPVGFPAPSPRG